MTINPTTLPDKLPGHWSTDNGAMMARFYATRPREELAMADMSDMELANHIYMMNKFDFSMIAAQTAAKERIRWLSARLALAEAALGEGGK